LPLVKLDFIKKLDTIGVVDRDAVLDYLNAVVLALNSFYGIRLLARCAMHHAASQCAALDVISTAVCRLHGRLCTSLQSLDTERVSWLYFESGASAEPLTLVAESVDVPLLAGTCDPLNVVSPHFGQKIADAQSVFPSPPPGLNRFRGFWAGEREQYVALIVRQLRARLLTLAGTCKGGGTIFPVGKSLGRQRAVWHGTRVSEAAAAPPAPRHLADPSAFAHLDLPGSLLLQVTKRDCMTWFDQLVLPHALRPFMARPKVTLGELQKHGVTDAELGSFLLAARRSLGTPGIRYPACGQWASLGRLALPRRPC